MTLTMRQALEIWPLNQGQLLAGAGGLDNEVSWAHIVEVFQDPYFFSPGVLVCSTGYGLSDHPDLQASVMREARNVQIAGILMKTGYELQAIPEEMLAAADEADIPFVKFPQGVPFSDVTKALAGPLLHTETESFGRARRLLRSLMEAHALGGGFQSIARILGESLACTAFVTDRKGQMLATHVDPKMEGPAPETAIGPVSTVAHLRHYSQRIGATTGIDRLFRLNRIVALPSARDGAGGTAFIAPIRFEGRMRGFVGVIREPGLTDLTHWAIETAALVAASEYRAMRVQQSTEQRLAGNLLDALIGDAETPDPHMLDRLAAWGYDISRPCQVVLVEIDPAVEATRKGSPLERLRPWLDTFCGGTHCEPVTRFLENTAIALRQPGEEEEDPGQELIDLHDRLARQLRNTPIWITAGRSALPAAGLRGTYDEALRAMAVARRTLPRGGTLAAQDLGLDNILIDLAGSSRVLDYVGDILGPVLRHGPEQSRKRLLTTLRAYLAADADANVTAERMFLHPNTVRYRLRTVEDLTGLSLRSGNDRTLLTVALRLLELGDQTPPSTTGSTR